MTDNDRLPARALTRIFALKDQEQQALTLTRANQSQISELQRAIGNNPYGDKATAFGDELARLQDAQPLHQSRHRALADLVARIEHYLATLPATVRIDEAKRVKPKLKPGQTHQQAAAELRGQIVKLTAERSQVERAELPIDEIKAQAKKWITERAMKARPQIIATHERFFDVKFTLMDESAYAPVLDTLALLAWFDPARMEEALNELIDQMPKPKFALTPAKKAQRLAEITSALFDLEKLECAHLEAAQEEGTIIAHRPNVSVEALLGIAVSRSEANAA